MWPYIAFIIISMQKEINFPFSPLQVNSIVRTSKRNHYISVVNKHSETTPKHKSQILGQSHKSFFSIQVIKSICNLSSQHSYEEKNLNTEDSLKVRWHESQHSIKSSKKKKKTLVNGNTLISSGATTCEVSIGCLNTFGATY